MIYDVKEYVQKCEICEECKNFFYRQCYLLKKYIVGGLFERIVIDIVGLFFMIDRKYWYILLIGDYFIKFIEVYLMENMFVEIVVDILFRVWVKCYINMVV